VLTRRQFGKGLLGFALAGLLAGGNGFYIEPVLRLRVQRWVLQPEGWRRGQRLRIVMLADLHAGGPNMTQARIEEIVHRANGLGGDLIALMGDYRATHPLQTRIVPIEASAEILAGLRAPLGVHAVLGNHDWRDQLRQYGAVRDRTHTQKVLEAQGIPVLANRAVKIGAGGDSFWLAGLDSQSAFQGFTRRRDRWSGMDDLPGTLAQLKDDAPVVLMAHEPDIFVQVPDRVALTLSGHTHGGQVRFGPWAPVVNSLYGSRFAWGHIREGRRDLVVSGGLGCSVLPLRFGVPPEITVVDLS
jgi:uncharacterized protein